MPVWISAFFALLKIFPKLAEGFEKIAYWAKAERIEAMKKENAEVIKTATDGHDQIPLEKVIGSKTAGEVSGVVGTEIRDSLPRA